MGCFNEEVKRTIRNWQAIATASSSSGSGLIIWFESWEWMSVGSFRSVLECVAMVVVVMASAVVHHLALSPNWCWY